MNTLFYQISLDILCFRCEVFSVSIVILNPLFVLSESFDFYQCESMQIYSFSVRLVSEDPSSKLKLLLDYVLTEVFFFLFEFV